MPLWKFKFETEAHFEITAVCWNPRYSDLFAATFGSFDFYRQVVTIIGLWRSAVCHMTTPGASGLCLPLLPEEPLLPRVPLLHPGGGDVPRHPPRLPQHARHWPLRWECGGQDNSVFFTIVLVFVIYFPSTPECVRICRCTTCGAPPAPPTCPPPRPASTATSSGRSVAAPPFSCTLKLGIVSKL